MASMKCFTKRSHILNYLLLISPSYCLSFFTSQRKTPTNSNGNLHNYPASHMNIHSSTLLSLGRERRISSWNHQTEEKLISDEEAARQKRMGQMKQRLQKEVKREDRISVLEVKLQNAKSMVGSESKEYMPQAERAELAGLLKVRDNFEEQYDPLTFTKEHLEFKAMHNDAFIQLSKCCEKTNSDQPVNVFFLDGPDGGTASALIERGDFEPSQCYVANRHGSTCESLRISGGGLLPDENVVCATASEALTLSAKDVSLDGAFAHIDFAAYYFDGCGGFVPHVIGMLSAALLRPKAETGPIAVGYSLLGGNKDVVGKELAISRALTIIARRRGMRMVHVLDDPSRYGISPDIRKIGGSNDGTFTTWLLLQPGD